MDYENLLKSIQAHMTDGLLLVVGSGLSAAEGLPGMVQLAEQLLQKAACLDGKDAEAWTPIADKLQAGDGLESALLKHPPTDSLEDWIVRSTCEILLPEESRVMAAAITGTTTLRLSKLLAKLVPSASGLPILTPNYDRLVEVACELSGYHVDTTAIGHYAGEFDHKRSCMAACKGTRPRGKTLVLEHFPRAVVLKPHGSFDWYHSELGPRRCSVELDHPRLIITPGLNKYRAGYEAPFDSHRELANEHIRRASRLLVVGYGFNDDHLQVWLTKRMKDGTPTIILTRTASVDVVELARQCSKCVLIQRGRGGQGVSVTSDSSVENFDAPDIWDIGVLVDEVLQ